MLGRNTVLKGQWGTEQTTQGSYGCPSIQGQVGWGPEQPDLVGSNEPMAGLELGELSKLKSLLTRAVLRFCDSIYVILNREFYLEELICFEIIEFIFCYCFIFYYCIIISWYTPVHKLHNAQCIIAQWFVLLTDSGLESSQFRNNSEICPWSAVSKMLHLYVPLFPFQHHLFCLITAKALHHKDLPFTGICEMFFTAHLWIHSGHRTAKPTLITAINNKCCNLSAVIALLLTTQETKILRSKKQEKFNMKT